MDRCALVAVESVVTAVSVTIKPEKSREVSNVAEEFLKCKLVDRHDLRQFAGLCSWVGSVTSTTKPYSQMLWAAASSRPAAGESEDWVARARIRLPLRWLRAFALDEMASVARLFPVVPSFQTVVLAFDASLSGGATLTTAGGTMSYTATQWTEPEHQVLGAAAHDPAFQALWEAYMLLVALYTWRSRLADEFGQLVIHGDAQGVLQAVIAKKARSPVINLVVAEMKLALGRSMHSVAAAHFWREENTVCDALSRLHEGAQVPAELPRG